MKKAVAVVLGALTIGSVSAKTVAWYRFDEGEIGHQIVHDEAGTIIANECSGSAQPRVATIVDGAIDAADASAFAAPEYAPTYALPFPADLVYDPVSDKTYPNKSALKFRFEKGSDSKYRSGVVLVPGMASGDLAEPTHAITVECFVCVTGKVYDTFAPIVTKAYGANWKAESFALYLQSTGMMAARFRVNGTATAYYNFSGKPRIDDGRWHHVALTYNNEYFRLYVDYVEYYKKALSGEVQYSSDTAKANDHDLCIGGSGASGRCFPGYIDEVRISDAALSASQFLRLQDDNRERVFRYRPQGSPFGRLIVTNNMTIGNTTYPDDPYRAYLVKAGTADAYFSTEKYADQLRDDMYSPARPMSASVRCCMDASKNGGLVRISNFTRNFFGNTAQSFTIEAVFASQTETCDHDQVIFRIGSASTAKLIFKNGSSRLVYAYCDSNGNDVEENTSAEAYDTKWHHAAYVYDHEIGQIRVYLDRVLVGKKNVRTQMLANTGFFIGATHSQSSYFDGYIGDVRVTKGALSPSEFLSDAPVQVDASDPTLLLAPFDDSLDSAVYPELIGSGTGEAQAADGEAPSYGAPYRQNLLLGGKDTREETADLASVVSVGSRWGWNYTPLLEQGEFTVEFFAKISQITGSANLIRYNSGDTLAAQYPIWACYCQNSTDRRWLIFRTQLITNGVTYASTAETCAMPWQMNDSRWHHYAISYQPHEATNTMISVYGDYQLVTNFVANGRLDYAGANGGRLGFGGSSAANNFFNGLVDSFRYSRGVLPPEKFIRKALTGQLILIR